MGIKRLRRYLLIGILLKFIYITFLFWGGLKPPTSALALASIQRHMLKIENQKFEKDDFKKIVKCINVLERLEAAHQRFGAGIYTKI